MHEKNDEERLHRLVHWRLGRIQRHSQGWSKSHGMGVWQNKSILAGRAGWGGKITLCRKLWSEARTNCGKSPRQRVGKGASRCHICARIATVSPWKTASGGSLEKRAQRNNWWYAICGEIRLEATKQAVGCTSRRRAYAQIWSMRWSCWRACKKMKPSSQTPVSVNSTPTNTTGTVLHTA